MSPEATVKEAGLKVRPSSPTLMVCTPLAAEVVEVVDDAAVVVEDLALFPY